MGSLSKNKRRYLQQKKIEMVIEDPSWVAVKGEDSHPWDGFIHYFHSATLVKNYINPSLG